MIVYGKKYPNEPVTPDMQGYYLTDSYRAFVDGSTKKITTVVRLPNNAQLARVAFAKYVGSFVFPVPLERGVWDCLDKEEYVHRVIFPAYRDAATYDAELNRLLAIFGKRQHHLNDPFRPVRVMGRRWLTLFRRGWTARWGSLLK
jgi:hypothetical protein